jgi:hypothetical protein
MKESWRQGLGSGEILLPYFGDDLVQNAFAKAA